MDDAWEIDRPDVMAEVLEAFTAYEADLVANRIERLVQWFWLDDRAVRLGIDEETYGFDHIAAYRRAQAVATPPRALRNTVITTFGTGVATALTEFVPEGSSAIGRQSQTWIRTEQGWRIASAHVSWSGGRRP